MPSRTLNFTKAVSRDLLKSPNSSILPVLQKTPEVAPRIPAPCVQAQHNLPAFSRNQADEYNGISLPWLGWDNGEGNLQVKWSSKISWLWLNQKGDGIHLFRRVLKREITPLALKEPTAISQRGPRNQEPRTAPRTWKLSPRNSQQENENLSPTAERKRLLPTT